MEEIGPELDVVNSPQDGHQWSLPPGFMPSVTPSHFEQGNLCSQQDIEEMIEYDFQV